MINNAPKYYSANEVAEIFKYHPERVRTLAREGKIPALKRGRVWLFEIEKLQAHFQNENQKPEDTLLDEFE